jgi:predicted RNA binding protein YcfA (HicA-like mRNA interferase family)
VSKLGNISGKEAAKDGWIPVGQVGSHLTMSKAGQRANLTVPQHKELSIGTLRALIRLSGLSVDEFLALL